MQGNPFRHSQKGGKNKDWFSYAKNTAKVGYEASSVLGKMTSFISMISGIIFGSVFIFIGWLVLSFRHGNSAQKLRGTVVNSECIKSRNSSQSNSNKSCENQVQYTYQGKDYKTFIHTSKRKTPDQTMKIIIPDPVNRPQDAVKDNDTLKFYIGWGLIILGIIIIFGTILLWYIVQKNKMASAAYGIGSAFSLAT